MTDRGSPAAGPGLRFNFLPVAQKELIELSGLRRTYVVRVAFAAALMLGLFITVNTAQVMISGNPAHLIGIGRIVFSSLVFWLFFSVLLLLPGMVASAFPRERDHGTLALLILTGLPPWRIVTEKMIGRLVPMGTLLFAAFPLLAFTYAMGGVTMAQLVNTSYLLVVTCLQVGAFAIMVSVVSRTARGAVLRAYGAGLIFVAGVLIVSIPIWLPLGGRGIPVAPILALLRLQEPGTFAGLVLESVPSLIVAGLCLWNAAACLARAGRLDSSVSDIHHTGSRVGSTPPLSYRRDSLPDDQPLAWRERGRDAAPWYLLLAYLVFLCVLLALGPLFGSSYYRGLPATPVEYVILSLALLFVVLVTQQGARAFVAEREHRTLEVLLTTPLSGTEIVQQKAWQIRRLLQASAVIFAVLFGVEAAWETQLPPGQGWGLAAHLVVAVLVILVYGPLAYYFALGFGLRARTGETAGLLALGAALAWIALPLALVNLFRAVTGLGPAWQVLEMMSPAAMLLWLEQAAGPLNPWFLAAINFTGYGLLLRHLRRQCLRFAGVWLGRVEAKAA